MPVAPRVNSDFEASNAKRVIRRQWDQPILASIVASRNSPLSYFGLPGPALEDVIDWKPLLSVVTCVEAFGGKENRAVQLDRHRRLNNKLCTADIARAELLRGFIEDIILNTTDADGLRPVLCDAEPAHIARFHYDLANLDFCGGVGYVAEGGVKRVRALRRLFERQMGTDFVLMLTVNVRDKVGKAAHDFLTGTGSRLSAEARRTLEWYASRGAREKEYVLKATVPLLVQKNAEDSLFEAYAYPPIAYTGTGQGRMVHFVFRLTCAEVGFQAFSRQSVTDILNLPLMTVAGPQVCAADAQHPWIRHGPLQRGARVVTTRSSARGLWGEMRDEHAPRSHIGHEFTFDHRVDRCQLESCNRLYED